MKNISRRVFIKGLAVAGVAAAASTVLAGCNTDMIPGVDDGKDDTETPEAPVTTITFTDPEDSKNTLTVVSKGFALGEAVLGSENTAEISFLVENKLGQVVGFVSTDLTANATSTAQPNVGSEGEYYVQVSAYADGNTHQKVEVVTTKVDDMIATTGGTGTVADDASVSKTLSLDVEDVKKTVTVKMALKKIIDITGTKVTVKQIGDAKEITYNL